MEGVSKRSEVVSTGQQVEKGPGTSEPDFFFLNPCFLCIIQDSSEKQD